jgi:hypothetical protein
LVTELSRKRFPNEKSTLQNRFIGATPSDKCLSARSVWGREIGRQGRISAKNWGGEWNVEAMEATVARFAATVERAGAHLR